MCPTLGKPKRRMTQYQTQTLLKMYEENPFLELEERHQLAKSLNISKKRITDWFVQRRKREKRSGMLLCDGEQTSVKVHSVYDTHTHRVEKQ